MKPLVIYHKGCIDGFCAAWVCRKAFPDAEFHAASYGSEPPLHKAKGRPVLLVDFTYRRQQLQELLSAANGLTILDHHASAQKRLKDFPGTVFDMERSGAGLAFDELVKGPRPPIVDYVEDRDLWRHALPDTREINAYISTIPFEFEAWDKEQRNWKIQRIVAQGSRVQKKVEQFVREVAKNAIRVKFQGYEVPLVNAPQVNISELVGHLSHGEPFAMGWWQQRHGFSYSLRVDKASSDVNVAELAEKYGGGGHPTSAGFQVRLPIHIPSRARLWWHSLLRRLGAKTAGSIMRMR